MNRLAGGQVARRAVESAIVLGAVLSLALGAVLVRPRLAGEPHWVPGAATSSRSDKPGPPPTRLRIGAIDVDTRLESLRLDAKGTLQAPKDYAKAGWYVQGTRPGDVGPAIIAGHVDSYQGPAVFFRLHELRPGQTIEVARGKTWVTFRVLAVRRYPKTEFPTDEVYGPTPNPQLRLITCGGAFDNTRRSYLDNVVVYAVVT